MESKKWSNRRELIALLACVLVGAVIRLWMFGSLGLTHFDEGIYAFSGAWSVTSGSVAGIDPMVIPYAPAGFPILVGLNYLVLGAGDGAAILASTFAGIATIPLVFWLARRTFVSGAGISAAVLATLSMAHIAFSRKALTDAPFLFVWTLSLTLGGRFLESPRLGRALVFGIAVGVAQNFKYNGWLTGIIIILAAAIGPVVDSESRTRTHLLRTFGFGLLAALLAFLIYAPWYDFVERHGGYSDLVRHHRSYLSPPSAWFSNWQQQLKQATALSGGKVWCAAAWSLAWLSAMWAGFAGAPNRKGTRSLRIWLAGVLVGGAVVFAGIGSASWWLGWVMLPRLLQRSPATRVIAAWWLLLSIMTPFYHPYARLWLPLEACGWLITAASIREFLALLGSGDEAEADEILNARPIRWIPVGVSTVFVIAVFILQPMGKPFSLSRMFQGTSSIRDGVAKLATTQVPGLSQGDEILVLGRRPISFYLAIQGRFPFRLVAGLDTLLASGPRPRWALIDSVQVTQDAGPRALPSLFERTSIRQRVWAESLDPVTLLDVRSSAAEGRNLDEMAEGWLIRIEGEAKTP
ncbi:ArnT family glycosyltransferase [Singulisphaera sp. PoT]|uniref:ArnT family glycosyltransferase n=1 Tax=Singulisphaera sp. PoT TaxID=3411797 RepID=UPI003BF5E17C